MNDIPEPQNSDRTILEKQSKHRRYLDALNRDLKQGIWLYFALLIFEGALRKWVVPGLATPLLLIRDPIAIWLVIMAWRRDLLPATPYLVGMVVIGLLGIVTAIFLGHGNLAVAVYGARILLFHFPLIFVIGRIFNRDDVVKMGKVCLWLSLPMTVLMALQFYSPQSAWVNRGVGGDTGGAGFSGALGFFRPPGTFSFTNGSTLFYSLVSSYVFYFWLYPQGIQKYLLLASTACLLAAIPLSISRGFFFQVLITLLFACMAIFRKPKYLGKLVGTGVGLFIALIILSNTSFFQTATEAFFSRFDLANQAEGGAKGVFVDRYLGGMIGAVSGSSNIPFFGYGLGMGTNVGSILLSGGLTFLIAEGEWGRLIGEMGPLMGIAVIFIRMGLMIKISLACYRKLVTGDLLPWLLLSFGIMAVPQSQWAQPTALGFSTLIAGLMIASLKKPSHVLKPMSLKKGDNTE